MFFKRFPASITLNFYHITLSLLFNLASTDFARFNYFVIAYKEGKEFTPANADSYDPNVCKDFLTDPVKAAVAPMAVIEIPLAVLLNLRSEEHTSELQSRFDLVCRLLLE